MAILIINIYQLQQLSQLNHHQNIISKAQAI